MIKTMPSAVHVCNLAYGHDILRPDAVSIAGRSNHDLGVIVNKIKGLTL